MHSQINSTTTHVVATRQRKTSKVKTAAQRPKIKIVTVDWLLSAFSTWEKPDEEPFKIDVEPDEHGTQDNILDVLAGDENGQILSGEDDVTGDELDTGATPSELDDAARPGGLTINVDGQEQVPFDQSVSPTDNVDWSNVDDELKEFLGSDSESERSDDSHASDTDTSTASKKSRKRKRSDLSAENSENEASSDENPSLFGQGSELQKRKRQALTRVTSLTNVTTVEGKDGTGLPSPDTTGPEETQDDGDAEVVQEGGDGWGSEAEADFEAEFAKDEEEVKGEAGGGGGE